MKRILLGIALAFAGLAALYATGMISGEALAFGTFISAVSFLLYADRKHISREGVMFMRRTKKGMEIIDKIARLSPRFWNIIGYAGVGMAVIISIFIVSLLAETAYRIFTKQAGAGGAGIILPGPVSSPISVPGIFIVPWWIWIIGIIAVVVPHEMMHGILCRANKVRIKSVGWAFFLFVPAAFVEPDEKQLSKSKTLTKLKVYAAGSFANIAVAGMIAMLLMSQSGAFTQAGMAFPVIKDSPAFNSSLSGAIISIDGASVRSPEELKGILDSKLPGDAVTVGLSEIRNNQLTPLFSGFFPSNAGVIVDGRQKYVNVTLGENNGTAYLGVFLGGSAPAYITTLPDIAIGAYMLLFWIYTFSFGVGLFNLLPMKPLDGGPFFQEIISKYTPHAEKITKYVSIAMAMLVLFNLFGVYLVP
ncbi:MAG: site-2 protease family protein [Candidatus Aenigmarchaeota archaeon]|nr:site-2 protease family protein [Candidatus Aenigmarchaeota archaeon]